MWKDAARNKNGGGKNLLIHKLDAEIQNLEPKTHKKRAGNRSQQQSKKNLIIKNKNSFSF